jgi:hypothetical protein
LGVGDARAAMTIQAISVALESQGDDGQAFSDAREGQSCKPDLQTSVSESEPLSKRGERRA